MSNIDEINKLHELREKGAITEAEFEKLRELVRQETDQVDAHVMELHEEIRALRAELKEARGE